MTSFVKPPAAEAFHMDFLSGAELSSSRGFSISDPSENLLRVSMLESGWMMNNITLADINESQGNAVSIGDNSLHTGRSVSGRFGKNIAFNGTPYTLEETDSCATISYDQMSLMINSGSGEQGEFNQKMSDFFGRAFTLDMLRVGFNGRMAAIPTNPAAYPKGEDVKLGWHSIAREFNEGSQVITDELVLGDGGDFAHLDSLTNHLINKSIPEAFREDPRLVVLVGADLAAAERMRLFNGADRPADRAASQLLTSSVAGRFAFVPPFMPGRRLAVTTLDNLHIYTQRGSRRFRAEFVENRCVYEHSYLRMEGYALGDGYLYAAVDESALKLAGLGNN